MASSHRLSGRVLLQAFASEDDATRQEAIKALGAVGRAAVPELVDALQDADWQVRIRRPCARILGPEASSTVPALIGVLQEVDSLPVLTRPRRSGALARVRRRRCRLFVPR